MTTATPHDTRHLLRDTLERFLGDQYAMKTRRSIIASEAGWSASIWAEMAALGILAAPFPETQGGFGCDILMTLMEAFGRALLLEPYTSSVIIGGALFEELGADDCLQQIANGNMRLAFAHDEAPHEHGASEIGSALIRAGRGRQLSGRKIVVRDAPCATHWLVSARVAEDPAALALLFVPAASTGVQLSPYPLIDGSTAADITLDAVPIADAAVLSCGHDTISLVRRLLDRATVAVCGEAIGVMRSILEQTVGFCRQRKQFGRPLSSFQALQFRMVDMLVEIEQAHSLTLRATLSPHDAAAVSAAKIRVNNALLKVAHDAVQLHGGIGTTEELDLSQYFRRSTAIQRQYGTSAWHLRRLRSLLAGDLIGQKSAHQAHTT